MVGWKRVLLSMVNNAETQMDKLRYRLYYSLGGPGPVKILTYRGYGTSERMYLRGRVLEDKNIPEAEENDRTWENLLSMYKRIASDEVPHARLLARFQDQELEIVADEEGLFEVWIEPRHPLEADKLWHQVELELLGPIPDEQRGQPVTATGDVLVPPETARYVVVSDIDDTVLQSDATHIVKTARHVFLGNAHTRLPFPGVAALYRALFHGQSGQEHNPMFYVSSSPWNMYDLLSQFFNLQDIPHGPVLFLRDWGIKEDEILPIRHRAYKTGVIKQMLDFYPHMPFILMGDSGQEDPEIYADIVREYGDRIIAVYIRSVSRDLKRPEAVQALAEEVLEAGSVLVLADDSLDIAHHAIEKGLISPASLPDIRGEKAKDEEPATPLEKLLGEDEKVDGPTVRVEGDRDAQVVKSPEGQRVVTKDSESKGAVDEALKNTGDEKKEKPPTVVVEDKKKKEQ